MSLIRLPWGKAVPIILITVCAPALGVRGALAAQAAAGCDDLSYAIVNSVAANVVRVGENCRPESPKISGWMPLRAKDKYPTQDLELRARRNELDTRRDQLEMQQAVIDAANAVLDKRERYLAALNASVDQLTLAPAGISKVEVAHLAAIYQGMVPAVAARDMQALPMRVLVPLARAINPRKLAPIMAQMSVASATALTKSLAEEMPVSIDARFQGIGPN